MPLRCLVRFITCRTILKLFTYDNKEYKGTVQGIHTRVETDGGVEEGLFYWVA
jgi:hypothetical protein